MKGADAVICAIGSSGFNPKGPQTVDYEVSAHQSATSMLLYMQQLSTYLVFMYDLCEDEWRLPL